MDTQQANAIQELVKKIEEHRQAYYSGQQKISDTEYDELEAKLRKLDPNNKVLQKIGTDTTTGYPKVKHAMKIGSQNKASDKASFLEWFKDQKDTIYVVEEKIDGTSLELQYKKGILKYAVTRGDGIEGDDITPNAVKMKGVFQNLPSPFTGSIRGELVLPNSVFAVKYALENANPRNMTAGIMKRKNGQGCEDLLFIAYDMSPPPETPTECKKIEYLQKVGFKLPVVRTFQMTSSDPEHKKYVYSSICSYRDDMMNLRGSPKQSDYNYDGLVVKNNQVDENDLKRDKPNKQIAFKFDLEIAVTDIINVEWYVSGRTRTPVAVFNPVHLHGTQVSKASLSNPRIFESFDIRRGTTVHVQKSGEIIPQIVRSWNTEKAGEKFGYPEVCEFCGTKLVKNPEELFCPNLRCPSVTIHRISKWISIHKIQFIGDATVKTLYELKLVRDIDDLYKLTNESLVEAGFGNVMAQKIISQIANNGRITTISKFVAGLDIQDVGESVIDLVVKHFKIQDFAQLYTCVAQSMSNVRGIGDILGRAIFEGIRNHEKLIKNILKFVTIETPSSIQGKLSGMTIVITGAIQGVSRAVLRKRIESLSGKFSENVTRETTYVVTDENNMSAKMMKAKQLGIKVISSRDLMKMMD